MKSNYSSWPTIILFLHFKFYFLLLFTALEQELYCCAKSAKKITPDRLWHSSLKKQTGQTPCESGESRPRRTCASASIRKGDGRGQHPFWPCDPRECGHFCSCCDARPCLCCSPKGRNVNGVCSRASEGWATGPVMRSWYRWCLARD